MPLYDFKCKKCGHEFEEQVSLEAMKLNKDRTDCPQCGCGKADRLITNPGHYKHGSWSRWSV